MQLDSHHRFVKDWDTKCIKMLHDSDAGEYSVLSTYAPGYGQADITDYFSETEYIYEVKAMSIWEVREDA